MQELDLLHFPGRSVHERAPNAARIDSLSRDFVHTRVPHVSICCLENCQIIEHQKKHKMITEFAKLARNHYEYRPKIILDQLITHTWTDQLITIKRPNLDQLITSQLQFPGTLRDASITESKCFKSQEFKCPKFQNFACIIGAPVGFTGSVPKTAILGKI